jgi:toxin CptA
MNHYNLKPIRLTLQPSRWLVMVLALAAVAAGIAIALLPLPLWQRVVLALPIAAAAVYHVVKDALLRMPWSIVALEVTSEGALQFQTRAGAWYGAKVRGDSFVTPWLTVLNLTEPEKRWVRRTILLSDSGDAEMFRHLRVWLRWGSQAMPE